MNEFMSGVFKILSYVNDLEGENSMLRGEVEKLVQFDPYGDRVEATVIWEDDEAVTQKRFDELMRELKDLRELTKK